MKNMFKTYHDIMLYKERREFQEYGNAKKNYQVCWQCGSVYFKKSWHHASALEPEDTGSPSVATFNLCPACHMINNRQYEGILTIIGVPSKFRLELERLINSYAKKAFEEDCQHRLIAINKHDGEKWEVTATENQLAGRLAHKIQDVFTKVSVKTTYSTEPNDLERVTVSFYPLLLNPGEGGEAK